MVIREGTPSQGVRGLYHVSIRKRRRNLLGNAAAATNPLKYRELHPPAQRFDSLRAHAHAVSEPEYLLRLFAARPAMRIENDRMIPVAIDAPLARGFLDSVHAHQAFHKNLQQLHEKAEFLH